MSNRPKRSLRVLGLSLLAMLAIGATAAASAQAQWYIGESPDSGTNYTEHWKNGYFKMVIPGRNARVECTMTAPITGNESWKGYGEISNNTHLYDPTKLSPCTAYNLKTGAVITACPLEEPVYLTFAGTGETVHSIGEPVIKFGPECGIGVKVKFNVSSLSLHWDGYPSMFEEVLGSGSGNYGLQSATFETKETLWLPKLGGYQWGWL